MKKSIRRFVSGPIWPALMSGLIAPGMGQILNREFRKGFFLLFAAFGSLFWFSRVLGERLMLILPGPPESWQDNQEALRGAIMELVQETPGMFLSFQALMLIIWLFSIIDAFLTAKRRQR